MVSAGTPHENVLKGVTLYDFCRCHMCDHLLYRVSEPEYSDILLTATARSCVLQSRRTLYLAGLEVPRMQRIGHFSDCDAVAVLSGRYRVASAAGWRVRLTLVLILDPNLEDPGIESENCSV